MSEIQGPTVYPLGDEPAGEVGVDFSRTKNLGDYNSVRISVTVRMPVPVSKVGEAQASMASWAEGVVEAQAAKHKAVTPSFGKDPF